MNYLRYNVQFNIWYCEKCLILLSRFTFGNVYELSLYNQLLCIWVE